MIPELRRQFNLSFTADKYRKFLEALDKECGCHIEFRVSETPCFFPKQLIDRMSAYGAELINQLVCSPDYRKRSDASIPPQFNVPNETDHPMFVQVDFGLIRDQAGELQPRLVELQGFPSLYAYQAMVSRKYLDCYSLPKELRRYLSGLEGMSYRDLLYKAVVGQHKAENVVLLEIDPHLQKTKPDFMLTQRFLGIPTVNIVDVVKHDKKLFYIKDRNLVPIERIYNRAIVDEITRKNIRLPFDYRDELQVEWAGHPNWYFRISKFSLPYLKHESVPKTWFLDELKDVPEDRENYVLKPLYSFAGAGITFAPTDAELAAIPENRRHEYVLQQRMKFEPVIETPHGKTQAEIRIMYVWIDQLTPVLTLVRMGRGKMMGVDHNRNLEWVGGSAALYPPE